MNEDKFIQKEHNEIRKIPPKSYFEKPSDLQDVYDVNDITIPDNSLQSFKSLILRQDQQDKERRKAIIRDNKSINRMNHAIINTTKNDNKNKMDEIKELIIQNNKESCIMQKIIIKKINIRFERYVPRSIF